MSAERWVLGRCWRIVTQAFRREGGEQEVVIGRGAMYIGKRDWLWSLGAVRRRAEEDERG